MESDPERTRVAPSRSETGAAAGAFGRFVLVEKIGEGGMGEVWKARQTDLDRWVALKFVKGDDPEDVARFIREAQTAAKLSHPNIISVFEAGERDGRHYIAMDYVEGDDLKKRRVEAAEAMSLMRDAALAVHYAHEQGIVHRDLKPQNLMLSDRGRLLVMDFGLAKSASAAGLSLSGTVVGTPYYMSPEQARGERVDARSDVYSLGATLYELVTGQPPFAGKSVGEVLRMAIESDPLPPRRLNPRLERDAELVILKAMEKDAARRYQTARELAEDIGRVTAGEAIQARPPSLFYRARKSAARHPAKATAAVALALGFLGFLALALMPAWVPVECDVPGAQVWVDGRPTGQNAPARVRFLWARQIQVSGRMAVEHGGRRYEFDAVTVDVSAARPLQTLAPIQLVPDCGEVALSVDPPEAEVVALHVETGAEQYLSGAALLRSGLYRYEVRRAGYETETGAIVVAPGRKVEITSRLRVVTGSLVVTTAAEGARVRVAALDRSDEHVYAIPIGRVEPAPVGPVDGLPLPVGRYRLTFEKENHFTRTAEVEIRAGSAVCINATLEPQELWRFKTDEAVTCRPALADLDSDGEIDIVFGSLDGKVYALSGRDRASLWIFATHGSVGSSPALGDLDDDSKPDVVIGASDNYLYALSGRDGSVLWRAATQGPIDSSPALGDLDGDGTLDAVVGSYDMNVYALSGRDGSILWRAATQGWVRSSPALADLDGDGSPDAVVGSDDKHVYALSGRDGSILWRAATQGGVISSPALGNLDADGALDVIVGSSDKHIYALSGSDGKILWRTDAQDFVWSSPALGDLDGDGTPDAVIGSNDNGIRALSGKYGSILWRVSTLGDVVSSPALGDLDGDGALDVVVGSEDKCVHALSGRDGSMLWRAATQEAVYSSAALGDLNGDGTLDAVIGSDDGNIYGLSGKGGLILWRVATQDEVRSSPASADLNGDGTPDAVVGSLDHNAYALSGLDGSIIWRVASRGEINSSPALGNLDGDGTLDAVFVSSDLSVYAVSGQSGSIMWHAATEGEVTSSPALGDLDGDDTPDAVVASNDWIVQAFSGRSGSILWRAAIEGDPASSPVLSDLDGDGTPDVVVGSDLDIYAFSGCDGSMIWCATVDELVLSTASLGDVDGDRTDDVVIVSWAEAVYALSGKDGSLIWRVAVPGGDLSTSGLGDLDGDGRLDVVLGSHEEEVLALSGHEGSAIWTINAVNTAMGGPALANLDGDETPDVAFGSWDNHVYGISGRDGSILWRYATTGTVHAAPTLASDAVYVGTGRDVTAFPYPRVRNDPLAAARRDFSHGLAAAAERHATQGIEARPTAPLHLVRAEARFARANWAGALDDVAAARGLGVLSPEGALIHLLASLHAGREPDASLVAEGFDKSPAAFMTALLDRVEALDGHSGAFRTALLRLPKSSNTLVVAAIEVLADNASGGITFPSFRSKADLVMTDYAWMIGALGHLLLGNQDQAQAFREMASYTEPGRRFAARWPRDAAELRALLRLPETDF